MIFMDNEEDWIFLSQACCRRIIWREGYLRFGDLYYWDGRILGQGHIGYILIFGEFPFWSEEIAGRCRVNSTWDLSFNGGLSGEGILGISFFLNEFWGWSDLIAGWIVVHINCFPVFDFLFIYSSGFFIIGNGGSSFLTVLRRKV